MHSPKISVIVPVYNTEKYLNRCINSILAQTFIDFELLLVDDGASDHSGIICDEYITVDSRVRVFHKPNGGVSSARNLGLLNMRGEWVTFVDSDDSLPKDALMRLMSKATASADIVMGDFEYTIKGDVTYCCLPAYKSRNQYLESYVASDWIMVWACIIKADIFRRNNILFPEGLAYSEDFYTMIAVLTHCTEIERLNGSVYSYVRDNENSATATNYITKAKVQRLAFMKCLEDFRDSKDFGLLTKGISWKLLQAEQYLVWKRETIDEFRQSYPLKKKYLFSCPYISRKMKFLMWCVLNGYTTMAMVMIALKSKKI